MSEPLDTSPKVRHSGHMPKVENSETSTVLPDWMTASDAADDLGIERSTLALWAREGKITPLMKLPGIRGAYVFARADVERLAQERAA